MRIIDNKHDFYDYLQDSTDRLVFDRRRSFLFTKSMFCWQINFLRYWQDSKYRFVLLQCGATFWLILVTITEKDTYGNITNYTLEVLDSWKNYDKPNKLLKIDLINFDLSSTGIVCKRLYLPTGMNKCSSSLGSGGKPLSIISFSFLVRGFLVPDQIKSVFKKTSSK